MFLNRIQSKIVNILLNRGHDTELRKYYVDRFIRPNFGTLTQLAVGLKDHRTNTTISVEVLDRLIASWRAMQQARTNVRSPYEASGEWKAIIGESFSPLIMALDQGDRDGLNELLTNFFRKFGDFFGEPTNIHSDSNKRSRCEHFQIYASRWIDLYSEESLFDVQSPLICNPMGFCIKGAFYTSDTFRHNFYARRMVDLATDCDNPVVCEIGGGFGGFAYHLLRRPQKPFRYIDYDIPIICVVASYYLLSAFPEKRIRLFGEISSMEDPLRDCDVAILPNFVLPILGDQSVDICFNTCSFAELDEDTVREYMSQFERICRRYILHEDHSWTSDSKYAYYQPHGGFKHWDLSKIEPSRTSFKRVHKIPSPFHSDLFGEFFEWLYEKRKCS